MIERSKCRPAIKLASCLVSIIAIITLISVPDNGVMGEVASVRQSSQRLLEEDSQAKLPQEKLIIAKAAFSSKMSSFSPEHYNLTAFGDLEVILD